MDSVKCSGPYYSATFDTRLRHNSNVDLSSKLFNLHFPVLGPSALRDSSPLNSSKGLLRISAAAFPIMEAALVDEKNSFDEVCANIITGLVKVRFSLLLVTFNICREQYIDTH